MKLSTIICIGIFFFILDVCNYGETYKKQCDNDNMFFGVLIWYHILRVYMFLGWMLKTKKELFMYLTIMATIIIQWFINGNKCIVTEYLRKKCNNEYVFKDIIYYLGYKSKPYALYIYATYYVFCIVYTLLKLNK